MHAQTPVLPVDTMESGQPSEPNLPMSCAESQQCTAETDSTQVNLLPVPPSIPVSSFSPPACPHPSASPPAIRTAKRRGPSEQPIACQGCSIEATSGAEVAGVREPTGLRRSKRRRAPEAQVAESRLVSETAARQDSNDKQAEVEGDEGDPTDVEADFEETTAMAMKDRMVQRQHLAAWTWTLRTHTGSLPPSQESYGRCQDDFSKGRARR